MFVTGKNLYYSFDICPGSWKSMVHHHREGRVFSIDRVRSEPLAGQRTEDLIRWVRGRVPTEFFLAVDTDAVAQTDHATAKFATGTDGWLVGCGRAHSTTVVTNERSAPESRREVKLPDVCDRFAVQPDNTFAMLRALNGGFDWSPARW